MSDDDIDWRNLRDQFLAPPDWSTWRIKLHSLAAFSARRGPLRDLRFRFEPGLTALYGLNGAGKTSVLHELMFASTPFVKDDDDAGLRMVSYHLPDADQFFAYEPTVHFWREMTGYENAEHYLCAWHELRDFLQSSKLAKLASAEDLTHDEIVTAVHGSPLIDGAGFNRWFVGLVPDNQPFSNSARSLLRSQWEELGLDSEEESIATVLFASLQRSRPVYDFRVYDDDQLYEIRHAFDIIGSDPPPAWLPDPVVPLHDPVDSQINRAWVSIIAEWEEADLIGITADSLLKGFAWEQIRSARSERDSATDSRFRIYDNSGQVTLALQTHAQQLEARVNEIFADLLPNAPRLWCELRHESQAFQGRGGLTWKAGEDPDYPLDISRLSAAERRWAHFAIRCAVAAHPALVLIDEPETGLHLRAVRHLARGLIRLAERLDTPVVVSTHSPELLRERKTRLYHVQRPESGYTVVAPMPDLIRDQFDELGLDIGDALQFVRSFLLVEGRHDQVVLEAFLGDELAAARVAIVPMRGATEMPGTLDSRFLLDYTTARIVALVDNVTSDLVRVTWDTARAAAARGEIEDAIGIVREALGGKSVERKVLRTLLSRSIEQNLPLQRIEPFAFGAPDVLDYTDCRTLTRGRFQDWQEARASHAHHAGADFKSWLADTCGIELTDDAIREASYATADEIPADFTRLLAVLES